MDDDGRSVLKASELARDDGAARSCGLALPPIALMSPATRWRRTVWISALASVAILSVGCDAGRKPYDAAVAFEEQGKFAEAADAYDGVCRRAPESKLCPASVARAASVRLKLAESFVKDGKFTEAAKTLTSVLETGDDPSKTKAKAALGEKGLLMGLRWQKAVALVDKAAAWPDIEQIGKSDTPIAAQANEWLKRERPALLLAKAKTDCVPASAPACPAACDAVTAAVAQGAKEAIEAAALHAAYDKAVEEERVASEKAAAIAKHAEQVRIYPLLVQAEGLLASRAAYTKGEEARHQCQIRTLAADEDNVFGVLAACGEADVKKADKVKSDWVKLLEDIKEPTTVTGLEERWKKADEDGEYVRQTPKKPEDAPDAVAGSEVWTKFEDAGMRAALEIPGELSASAGVRGRFATPDGKVEIVVTGWTESGSIDDVYSAALRSRAADEVSYKHMGTSWCNLSGYHNGRMFYEKTLISAGRAARFVFQADIDATSAFKERMSHLERSLRVL